MFYLIPNIIFTVLVITALYIFSNNVKKIYRNINLGISVDRNDNKKVRLIQMLRIAFGQSKMIDKPIVGILHEIDASMKEYQTKLQTYSAKWK